MVANSFNFKTNAKSLIEMQNVIENQKHSSLGMQLMSITEENEGLGSNTIRSARGRKQSVMYQDTIKTDS